MAWNAITLIIYYLRISITMSVQLHLYSSGQTKNFAFVFNFFFTLFTYFCIQTYCSCYRSCHSHRHSCCYCFYCGCGGGGDRRSCEGRRGDSCCHRRADGLNPDRISKTTMKNSACIRLSTTISFLKTSLCFSGSDM